MLFASLENARDRKREQKKGDRQTDDSQIEQKDRQTDRRTDKEIKKGETETETETVTARKREDVRPPCALFICVEKQGKMTLLFAGNGGFELYPHPWAGAQRYKIGQPSCQH